MNGPHDIGGMTSFGPIDREPDEPVFHANWEARSLAITVAVGATGAFSIDAMRFARESIPPARYWSSSYYEIRTEALIDQLVGTGMLSEEELVEGKVMSAPVPVPRVLSAGNVDAALARGWPFDREPGGPAQFRVGDPVRARNIHPIGHTRLPLYVRGRTGTISRVHGVHVFPDSRAHGLDEDPRWLYSVRFDGKELWGPGHSGAVYVDLWEPYLEAQK